MAVELERAQRVGDAFDGIALPVRPVVGRVDVPQRAGAVVVHATDPVHDRIAELHVLVLHVDLRPEHGAALGELAGPHPAEQVEVLLDGSVPVGALDAGVAVAAPLRRDGLAVLLVDVGKALGDQQFSPVVELLEVVARVERLTLDRVPEPGEVGHDAVDVARCPRCPGSCRRSAGCRCRRTPRRCRSRR